MKQGPSTNSKKDGRSPYRIITDVTEIKKRVNTLQLNILKIVLFLFEEKKKFKERALLE